jgi:hypothetical protein
MKTLFTVLLLGLYLCSCGQVPGSNGLDVHDTIIMNRFNYKKRPTCQPEIIITKYTALASPDYHRPKDKRRSIAGFTKQIERVRHIVTLEFLDQLNRCCAEKGCGDTNNGYYIEFKRGNSVSSIYLDISFVARDKCGIAALVELIRIFNAIKGNCR